MPGPDTGRRNLLIGLAAALALAGGCAPPRLRVTRGGDSGRSERLHTGASLRTGPGSGYAEVGIVPAGTRLRILGTEGAWALVELSRGRGWVHRSLVGPGGPSAPERREDGRSIARTIRSRYPPSPAPERTPTRSLPPPCEQGGCGPAGPGADPGGEAGVPTG